MVPSWTGPGRTARPRVEATWHDDEVPYHQIRDPARLHQLLDAVLSVESDLDLDAVLGRIVDAAVALTGARYGALGVIRTGGKGLSAFVHRGIDDATARRIGHLPEGVGILGLIIREPYPLRLTDLTAHPESVGFPEGHPAMRSFLGVPICVHGEVFGNLYLTEKRPTHPTEKRPTAQLGEQCPRSTEDRRPQESLPGSGEDGALAGSGGVGALAGSGGVGALPGSGGVGGIAKARGPGVEAAPGFTEEDESLVVSLASAAGIAIANARLHERVAELTTAADRERIARDLHDIVIQRLFATGLSLQAALPLAEDTELRARIAEAVAELDDTIRQLRTTIFALGPQSDPDRSLRTRVLELCAEAARGLGFDPEVRFRGPLDHAVEDSLAAEVLATLREALSNVARHARAGRVEVDLSVSDGSLHLRVTDDGVGVTASPDRRQARETAPAGREPRAEGENSERARRASQGRPGPADPIPAGLRTGKGVPNMAARAEALGGSFSLRARREGGSELTWRVPLDPAPTRRASPPGATVG